MQRKLKGLLIEPNKLPEEIIFDNKLKNKQELVDGYIEYVVVDKYEDIIFICNEEGKINGMKPNRDVGFDILYGPVVIVGNDPMHGEDRSLTKNQIEKYKKVFDEQSIINTKLKLLKIQNEQFR